MNRILYLLAALTFVGCSATTRNTQPKDFSPDYSRDLPTSLDFSIKDGLGDSLIVHYFFGKLFVTEQVGSHTNGYNLAPTAQDWSAFWRSLDGVHIWDWGSGVDPGEPNFWSLQLSHGERNLSIDGTHFERGLHGELSQKKEGWIVIADAIQALTHHNAAILRNSTKEPLINAGGYPGDE